MNRFFKIILLPFALIYLFVVVIRNKCFDWKLLRSQKHKVPIICVGNIAVGGTGKSPHVEYVVNLLLQKYIPIAVLSRGYKRKTNSFLLAEENHNHKDIGDEPMQFKTKFNTDKVIVAVDSNRNRGVKKLLKINSDIKAIILDDAFQHRYIKAGLNILLTDFYNTFNKDYILPLGSLREPRSSSKRADIVVVTKSPTVISPIERRNLIKYLGITESQKLFFSKIKHQDFVPFNPEIILEKPYTFSTIFLFTGIVNQYPLLQYLNDFCIEVVAKKFPDHHNYSVSDIKSILKAFDDHLSSNKIIVTTEKDYMRLKDSKFKELLKKYPLFYVPIVVEIDDNDKVEFNNIINEYVTTNQRNE